MEEVNIGEAFIRRGATIAKVTDQYGDERIIYRQRGMRDLRIKNTKSTFALVCNRIAADFISKEISRLRKESGMTMEQFAEKAQIKGGKQRVYEIESNARKDGLRMGTLFAVANALGVDAKDLMPDQADVISAASEYFSA